MTCKQLIKVDSTLQTMSVFNDDILVYTYPISTGKNGMGEQMDSGCTPRGWHCVHDIIGFENEINSVFVGRVWTGDIYTEAMARDYPGRDWILTRIIQLDGLEPGKNKGGDVDSLSRYIYIHGTSNITSLGTPNSMGCIRMDNNDIIELADWLEVGSKVFIC